MNRPATAKEKREQQENTTLKQGFVKDEDLNPNEESKDVMSPNEVDAFARKAQSENRGPDGELQGEGDYEAADSYNQAATDFAQGEKGKKRP